MRNCDDRLFGGAKSFHSHVEIFTDGAFVRVKIEISQNLAFDD